MLAVGTPQLLVAQLRLQQTHTVVMGHDAGHRFPHPRLAGHEVEFLVKRVIALKITVEISVFQAPLLLQQVGAQAAHSSTVHFADSIAEHGTLRMVAQEHTLFNGIQINAGHAAGTLRVNLHQFGFLQ